EAPSPARTRHTPALGDSRQVALKDLGGDRGQVLVALGGALVDQLWQAVGRAAPLRSSTMELRSRTTSPNSPGQLLAQLPLDVDPPNRDAHQLVLGQLEALPEVLVRSRDLAQAGQLLR